MFGFIKNTFLDVFLLYKNFLNWNLNKFVIYIWSFLFAFLVSLPFLILMFGVSYLFGVDVKMLFSNLLNNELTSNNYINISFFLITFIFFIANFYKYILLNKINFDYLNGEKPKILKNYYFDFKIIKKYFIVSLINLLLFLGLFLFFLVIYIILFFAFGGFEGIGQILSTGNNNFFSIISLAIFVIFIISFVYLFYRIIFSYFIFIDTEHHDKKPFNAIKKSFEITKKFNKFIKFLVLIVLFSIFLLPSYIAISFFNNNISNINNYFTYKYGIQDDQKDQINQTYIQSLELEYSKLSIEELNNLVKRNSRYILFINIINYILFFGMYTMIGTSFYKRELLKDK